MYNLRFLLFHLVGAKGDSATIVTMPREAEPSANERAFMLQALQENIRMDGRTVEVARPLDYYRPLQISFGNEFGTADVQLGKTRYFPKLPSFQRRC